MKRPAYVVVFGKRYEIEWDSDSLDEELSGDHCQKYLRIRMSPDQAPDEERETLLHELTHAIEQQLGMNFNEKKVRALSVGLYALLRDNPKLRAYLFKGSK